MACDTVVTAPAPGDFEELCYKCRDCGHAFSDFEASFARECPICGSDDLQRLAEECEEFGAFPATGSMAGAWLTIGDCGDGIDRAQEAHREARFELDPNDTIKQVLAQTPAIMGG